MNEFYGWLYDYYVKPRLSGVPLSSGYYTQKQEWQAAAENLSRRDRLLACDLMDTLKNDWGTLVLACGVQLGLFLAANPFERKEL